MFHTLVRSGEAGIVEDNRRRCDKGGGVLISRCVPWRGAECKCVIERYLMESYVMESA